MLEFIKEYFKMWKLDKAESLCNDVIIEANTLKADIQEERDNKTIPTMFTKWELKAIKECIRYYKRGHFVLYSDRTCLDKADNKIQNIL